LQHPIVGLNLFYSLSAGLDQLPHLFGIWPDVNLVATAGEGSLKIVVANAFIDFRGELTWQGCYTPHGIERL
jgi:hypothetical protein